MKIAKLKTNKLIKECRNWDQVKLDKQLSFIKNVVNSTTNWPIQIGQKYVTKEIATKIYNIVNSEYERRYNETMAKCDKMRQEYQQNDAPVTVVKNPTPNMAEKTEPETVSTAKTNVKKILHKNRTKTIDKPKKNNYITNTIAGKSPKTKTTKKRSTMENTNTKNTLTKKQRAAYEMVYHHLWQTISRTIPMNNKKLRSAGFEMARSETIKLLKKIY